MLEGNQDRLPGQASLSGYAANNSGTSKMHSKYFAHDSLEEDSYVMLQSVWHPISHVVKPCAFKSASTSGALSAASSWYFCARVFPARLASCSTSLVKGPSFPCEQTSLTRWYSSSAFANLLVTRRELQRMIQVLRSGSVQYMHSWGKTNCRENNSCQASVRKGSTLFPSFKPSSCADAAHKPYSARTLLPSLRSTAAA